MGVKPKRTDMHSENRLIVFVPYKDKYNELMVCLDGNQPRGNCTTNNLEQQMGMSKSRGLAGLFSECRSTVEV